MPVMPMYEISSTAPVTASAAQMSSSLAMVATV
jgi:hypothetical protein